MRRRWGAAAIAALAACAVAGCGTSSSAGPGSSGGGSSSGSGSGGPIVIGATIPLTGAFGAFGTQEKIGDTLAVAQINKAGGIMIDGKRRKVVVKFLDSQSQPNLTTTQARTLVLQDHAVGLFGTIAPPLTIPLSEAADQLHVPFVHHTPVQAWLSGTKTGYPYSWDIFFNETQQTKIQYLATNEVKTNKRVVLFTDTDPDGLTMGKLWAGNAPTLGYKVVARESFPEGTTDFSSYIANAQSKKAEVLIAQMIPPDATALWKQMKAAGYDPKVAFCEKCAYQSQWGNSLGSLANGTMVTDIWSPAVDKDQLPLMLTLKKHFGNKINPGVSGTVGAYTCATVLLDAIKRAGSTNGAAINKAVGETDGEFPLGHVKFNSQHYSAIKAFQTQWRNGATVIVWPKVTGGSAVQAPVAGLK